MSLNATTCIQTKEGIVTKHLPWMLSKAKTATSTLAAQPSEKSNAVTCSLPCGVLQRVVVEGPARTKGCFPCRAYRRMLGRLDHDAKQRRLIGRINNRSAQPGNSLTTTRALTDHLLSTAITKEEGGHDGRRSRFAYGGNRMLLVRGAILPS
jgi:hypothetical protein